MMPLPGAYETPSEQLLVDAKIVAALAASGFDKEGVERVNASVTYRSMQVVPGLIFNGGIYLRARQRNPKIKKLFPPWPPLDWETCQEIADITVTKALPRFERKAIRSGEWSADDGATLATHFINMCIDAFPNEFRSWLRKQARDRVCVAVSPEDIEVLILLNPALVDDEDDLQDGSKDPRLRRLLACLSDRARLIVELRLDRYSNPEIARKLHTSPGAVASAYHRATQRLIQLAKEERS